MHYKHYKRSLEIGNVLVTSDINYVVNISKHNWYQLMYLVKCVSKTHSEAGGQIYEDTRTVRQTNVTVVCTCLFKRH